VAEDMNKAITYFREARSIRYAADVFKAPRTCLHYRIIVDGNNKKSKVVQNVVTPSNRNYSSLSMVLFNTGIRVIKKNVEPLHN
jgi:hypothetical protein